jgi:hypothetical protein
MTITHPPIHQVRNTKVDTFKWQRLLNWLQSYIRFCQNYSILFVQKERKRRTSHRTQNINDELVQNVPSFTEPIDIKHKVLVLLFFCLEITDNLVAFRQKKKWQKLKQRDQTRIIPRRSNFKCTHHRASSRSLLSYTTETIIQQMFEHHRQQMFPALYCYQHGTIYVLILLW